MGYLVSMFNKSLSVHVTYEGFLRELHGEDVFSTVIPHAKDYKEAVTYRKPIVEYKPKSAAAKSTAALADEFLAPAGDEDSVRSGRCSEGCLMAKFKEQMRSQVADSMRDRVLADHPISGAGDRSGLQRQGEGRRRLDAACTIRVDRIIAGSRPAPEGIR